MTRSTRRIEPPDVWPTVDTWFASLAGGRTPIGGRLGAWVESRCRIEATSDGYLDVLDPLEDVQAALIAAGLEAGPLPRSRTRSRPTAADPLPPRRAVGAAGTIAYPSDGPVAAALAEQGVAFRRVTAARRYAWRGPAAAPVLLEIATTPDHAVVQAWWEDVFFAWPRIGTEGPRRAAARRLRAMAAINRLLTALDQPPLVPPP